MGRNRNNKRTGKAKAVPKKSRTSSKRKERAEVESGFGRMRVQITVATIVLLTLGWVAWRSPWTSDSHTDEQPSTEVVFTNGATSRLATPRVQRRDREFNERLAAGEWATEAISDAAGRQLSVICDYLTADAANERAAEPVLSESIRFSAIRPENLVEYHRDSSLAVWHQTTSDVEQPFSGRRQFMDALQKLRMTHRFSKAKLKIFRIDAEESSSVVVTTALFEASGFKNSANDEAQDDEFEITSHWQCVWDVRSGGSPILMSLEVSGYEEVVAPNKKGAWLADCTKAVLGRNDSYAHELNVGIDDWVNRLDRRLMISRFGHHGISVGDANGDGLDDVYVCQPGGLPNRLYLQKSDGTAFDISADAKVDFIDYTTCAIFADLDNDGDQDLIVAAVASVVILANDGNRATPKFTPVAALPNCPRSFSVCVADYDADGLLDIYACRYRKDSLKNFELPLPVPYYDAANGGRNLLFRNQGEWQFEDVTHDVGLDVDNNRFSFAAAWEDYDNDGDVDLYVANDYGRNCLYRNDSASFVNVAADAGVEDIASGMSVSWTDVDHDGLMDLYVGNMFSSAGNRLAYQPRFVERFDAQSERAIQRHARGNTLFQATRNDRGEIEYRDVSVDAGVTMGRWAWSCLFADINNDSFDDLLVVNGLMSTDDTGDL